MRFWRKRYDPYPDLTRLEQRLMKEDLEAYMTSGVHQYIGDMILYATVGRDRKKLTPEYVTKTEATARKLMDA